MARPSRSLPRALALTALLLLLAAPGWRDLEVGVPPGPALDWTQAFSRRRAPERDLLGGALDAREARATRALQEHLAPRARPALDGSPLLRIRTWDLPAHLPWVSIPVEDPAALSRTGAAARRPAPPSPGEPFHWVTLAPLFRLLLHPGQVSAPEVAAHLVELGDGCLPALAAARYEEGLVPLIEEVERRVRVDGRLAPAEPPESLRGRAAEALVRFAEQELLRVEPYDPVADFGAHLFLLPERFFPVLVHLAGGSPDRVVRRNATAALARYGTPAAHAALADLAARTPDAVVLVRAAGALGRGGTELEPAAARALLERYEEAADPIERTVLLGALGRAAAGVAREAALPAVRAGLAGFDPDLLQPGLLALLGGSRAAGAEEVAAAEELLDAALRATDVQVERFASRPARHRVVADTPDSRGTRGRGLHQLVVALRARRAPDDEERVAALLELLGGRTALRATPEAAGSLDRLEPMARLPVLAAVARAGGERAEEWLEAMARGEDPEGRWAMALRLLPPAHRGALARSWLVVPEDEDEDEEPVPAERRLAALELLELDGATDLVRAAHAVVLAVLEGRLALDGVAARALLQRCLAVIGPRRLLSAGQCLALTDLVRADALELAPSDPELRAAVRTLVAQAAGTRGRVAKEDLAARIVSLVRRFRPWLPEGPGDEERVEGVRARLEGLGRSGEDPAYRALVEAEVLAHLLGRSVAEVTGVRAPGTFVSPVPLAEEVLLTVGRSGRPALVEWLVQVLAGPRTELHPAAALALGMRGGPLAEEALLGALARSEPFTRYCAGLALEQLAPRGGFVDWLGASPAARDAAVTRWRAAGHEAGGQGR